MKNFFFGGGLRCQTAISIHICGPGTKKTGTTHQMKKVRGLGSTLFRGPVIGGDSPGATFELISRIELSALQSPAMGPRRRMLDIQTNRFTTVDACLDNHQEEADV